MPKEGAANEVPTDSEGGRRASTSEGTAAKKATAFGEACCGSVGVVVRGEGEGRRLARTLGHLCRLHGC